MTGFLKYLGLWIVYGGLLLAAAAVTVLGRTNPPLVERLRLQVTDAVVPIDVLSRPVDALTGAAERDPVVGLARRGKHPAEGGTRAAAAQAGGGCRVKGEFDGVPVLRRRYCARLSCSGPQ